MLNSEHQRQLTMKSLLEMIFTSLGKAAPKFSIKIERGRVTLTTANAQDARILSEHLNRVLDSRAAFIAAMPYNIQGSSPRPIPPVSQREIPPPGNTVEALKQKLKNLFGPQFKELAIDIDELFDPNKGAKVKNGVLFSKPAVSRGVTQTWGNALQTILRCFADTDIEGVRSAYLGEKPLTPAINDDYQDEDTALARGLVQKCFGIQTKGDGSRPVMYFDANCLYQLIAKPNFAPQPQTPSTVEIDIKHLETYLQQLTQDGPLLKVFTSPENAREAIVQPLLIGRRPHMALAKPKIYNFVIDKSGSMSEDRHFAKLQKDLLEVIATLRASNPEAQVRIVFFAETTKPAKVFHITNDKTTLENYISSEVADGTNTLLFGTLAEELDVIKQNYPAQKDSDNIWLFYTDGLDNVENNEQNKTPKLKSKIAALDQTGTPRPKWVLIGKGKNVDTATLKLIADEMGGRYIHSGQDIQQERELLKEIATSATFNDERRLVDILTKFQEQSNQYTVTVYDDDSVTIPDVKIIVPMVSEQALTLTLQGKDYVVTINPEKVPAATAVDRLTMIMSSAHDTTLSTQPLAKQLTDLRKLVTDITQLQKDFPADKTLCNNALDEVTYYLTQVPRVSQNPNEYAALRSQVMQAKNLLQKSNPLSTQGCPGSENNQGQCGPTFANGPSELPNVIPHHFHRGMGSYESTVGYRFGTIIDTLVRPFKNLLGGLVRRKQPIKPTVPVDSSSASQPAVEEDAELVFKPSDIKDPQLEAAKPCAQKYPNVPDPSQPETPVQRTLVSRAELTAPQPSFTTPTIMPARTENSLPAAVQSQWSGSQVAIVTGVVALGTFAVKHCLKNRPNHSEENPLNSQPQTTHVQPHP